MGMLRRNLQRRAAKLAALEREKQDEAMDSTKTYSKTEINRMPVAELRKMAKKSGVARADEMTGAELKEHFINALGL